MITSFPIWGNSFVVIRKNHDSLLATKISTFLVVIVFIFPLIDHCRVKVEEERSLLPLTTFLRSHEIQTIQHILVTCVFSRQIWFHVLSLVGLQQYTPNDGNF
jgi:hypothetical protein